MPTTIATTAVTSTNFFFLVNTSPLLHLTYLGSCLAGRIR